MKSIPELRRELEDVKLRNQYKQGLKERRNLKRTIFYLKHPNAAKLKSHLGSNISKIASNIKSNASSKSHPVSSQVKHKTIYTRKLVKNKKGHYIPKYIKKKVKVHPKHLVSKNVSDPHGLNNIWSLPRI